MTRDSSLYPNTFQHPNLYVDRLAYFLTPEENTVLSKAVREILGFQDIENLTKQIALSIFIKGKFKAGQPKTEDNRLCYGCGLGRAAIIKALKALDEFGILVKSGQPNGPVGQSYTLQLDANKIDWDRLEERKNRRTISNTKRTKKATKVRVEGSTFDVTSNVQRTSTSNVGRTSTSNVGRTHGNPEETQKKPRERRANARTRILGNDKDHPAIQAYRNGMKQYPPKNHWPEIVETVTDCSLWQKVVQGWKLTGWNPKNTGGMLDYYRRREIPSTMRTNRNGTDSKYSQQIKNERRKTDAEAAAELAQLGKNERRKTDAEAAAELAQLGDH